MLGKTKKVLSLVLFYYRTSGSTPHPKEVSTPTDLYDKTYNGLDWDGPSVHRRFVCSLAVHAGPSRNGILHTEILSCIT